MKTKDIDLDIIKKIHGIDDRIKKEIIYNFKHQLNTTADNRFKEIAFYHDNYNINIKTLCKAFNVSRSAYYEYIKRKKNQKESKDEKIINAIRNILLLTADFVQNHPVLFVQNQPIFLSARDFFQIPGGHFSTILSGVLIHMQL